jgi:hypothetical protein
VFIPRFNGCEDEIAPSLHRRARGRAFDLIGVSSSCRQVDRSVAKSTQGGSSGGFRHFIFGHSLLLLARMVFSHDRHSACGIRGLEAVCSRAFDQDAEEKLSEMGAWAAATRRRGSHLHASTIGMEFCYE